MKTYHHQYARRLAKTSSQEAKARDRQQFADCKVWGLNDEWIDHRISRTANRFHSVEAMAEIGWGEFFKTLLSFGCFPVITSSASLRICIIASQNLKRAINDKPYQRCILYLSSSSRVSDSVGSINIQVGIGHEHVGGWKP